MQHHPCAYILSLFCLMSFLQYETHDIFVTCESFDHSTRAAAGSFLFDKWQTPKSCNNLEDFCFKTGKGVFNTVSVPAGTVESLKVLSTCGGGVEGRCDDLDLCSALCGYCYEFKAENGLCRCMAKLLSPEKAMKKVYDALGAPTIKRNPCRWTGVTCDKTTEEVTVTQIDLSSSKYQCLSIALICRGRSFICC